MSCNGFLTPTLKSYFSHVFAEFPPQKEIQKRSSPFKVRAKPQPPNSINVCFFDGYVVSFSLGKTDAKATNQRIRLLIQLKIQDVMSYLWIARYDGLKFFFYY